MEDRRALLYFQKIGNRTKSKWSTNNCCKASVGFRLTVIIDLLSLCPCLSSQKFPGSRATNPLPASHPTPSPNPNKKNKHKNKEKGKVTMFIWLV